MADDLDRLFERLVSVLAADAPGRLAVPFPAAEVYERLVPYRSNRSVLKVATHQDYEMAVLRLLAGERGYASLERCVPPLGLEGRHAPGLRDGGAPAARGRAGVRIARARRSAGRAAAGSGRIQSRRRPVPA